MKIREFVLGKPISTKQIKHERLSNAAGLAIFASDALSSTAYATEEILIVLTLAQAGHFVSLPIAAAISLLILVVAVSYRQVIHANPEGGGAYTVAKRNLGEMPALVGASSLLIDYALTAAVSVAAGVAAITSAIHPLHEYRTIISIGIIILLTWSNLRGAKESGKIFSIPTYIFIFTMFTLLLVGFWNYANGALTAINPPDDSKTIGALSLFLVLRAFASGCTAMTGIEATSNGVRAFKPPEAQNASKTLMRMAFILAAIFLGLTFLAYQIGASPNGKETVVSQIARSLFGQGPLYFLVQGTTAGILFLAANTPFAGSPRIASQLALDGYFPKQFANLGSRLVFANGIIFLAASAIFLLYIFESELHSLIPLYAVGVFVGFSIAQISMIIYWKRKPKINWAGITINSIGFLATTLVFVIVFISKFTEGAWVLIPAFLILIFIMKKIKAHYREIAAILALDGSPVPDVLPDKTMVILVSELDRAAIHGIKYAKSFQPAHIQAMHVASSEEEVAAFRKKWAEYVSDIRLDIVVSEYRDVVNTTLNYLKNLDQKWRDDTLNVVMPEFIPPKLWQHFLHNQTALRLKIAIEQDPEIDAEIIDIPSKIATKLR